MTVLGWSLRKLGLSSGSFRLGAEDLGFCHVTVLGWSLRIWGLPRGSFRLEAEDMRALKWQF